MEHTWFEPSLPASPPRLWVLLHGACGRTGTGIAQASGIANRAGAYLIEPQASRPSGEGYNWSFAADASGIDSVLGESIERHGLQGARIDLVGFSMGCTMALWLLMRQPHRYSSIALVGMGSAFERWEYDDGGLDETALADAARHVRALLAVDLRDPAGAPPHVGGYFAENLAHLRRIGFVVETFRPDRGRHEFTPEMVERVAAFLA